MSEKFRSYQQIHEQHQNNPGELAAQQRLEENKERQKRLPGDQAPKYLMDADQLKEYYEERNLDTDDNSFKLRTKYYFEDVGRATAKKDRYQSISNQAPMIDAYARRHGGRRANKRKGDARKAQESFHSMEQLMMQQMQDNNANLTPLQKYNRREEIMKHRMTGMVAAAQLKSKPGNMHHSMYRAQLSCYMILKDQLEHLIRERQSVEDRRSLRQKLAEVNLNIDNAYKNLKKYTPSVQKQWQNEHFNELRYNTLREGYQQACNRGVTVNMETTKMLAHLQKFHDQMGDVRWPARCVYKFRQGNAPLNPAERKLQEWNTRVDEIREHGSDYAKERVEIEGIRLFMSTELPNAATLKKKGAKYLEENLRTYYEMIHHALPYYRAELAKEEGFVFKYAQEHSDFEEKLDYLEAMKDYMEYRLSKDYGIENHQERGYVIRRAGRGYTETRIRGAQGQFEINPEEELDRASRFYGMFGEKGTDKSNLMPGIDIQAQRPADEEDEDEDDVQEEQNDIRNEEIILIPHPVRNDDNNLIRNEDNNLIRNEDNNLIRNEAPHEMQNNGQPILEPVEQNKAEDFPILENRLFSDTIVREEPKKEEQKKEEKEELKNEILEEKKEDGKEENKNEILEEKSEIKEEKKEDRKEDNKSEIIEEKKEDGKEENKNEILEEKSEIKEEKKEDRKEENKNEILEEKSEIREEKKEDRKEDNKSEIIEEREDSKNLILEEKKAEKNSESNVEKKAEKKNEQEENKNHIFIEDEEEEEENPNRINIIEEEAPVRMIRQATDLTDHQEYQKILTEADEVFTKYLGEKKEKDKEKDKDAINIIIEDEEEIRKKKKNEMVSSMMRLVHFDKKGMPITEEDRKNHAWNLKWLNAWKNDDTAVREEMISEELERLAAGMVRIPKKELPETWESEQTKDAARQMVEPYLPQLNKWVKTNVMEKENDGLVASLRKVRALSSLQKAHPGIKDYLKSNQAFRHYARMAGDLAEYIHLYDSIRDKKNRLSREQAEKQTALGLKILQKNQAFFDHENDDFVSYQPKPYLDIETEADREKELRSPKMMEDLQLTESHFGKKLTKKQSKELAFAKKQFGIMKRYRKIYSFEKHKDYQALYQRTAPIGGASLGREYTVMMRPVLFDKHGTPLPKYEKNHQWNLRWLKLWEKKEHPDYDKELKKLEKEVPKNREEQEKLAQEKERILHEKEKWEQEAARIEKEKEKMFHAFYLHTLDAVSFPEVKLNKADMEFLRQYKKASQEEGAVEKRLNEREEVLIQANPGISNKELKADPVCQKIQKELDKVREQRKSLEDEMVAVSKRFVSSKQFKDWIDHRLNDDSEREIIGHLEETTLGSVDKLREKLPALREFEKQNPKFVMKGLLTDKSHALYNDFVSNNYGVDISAKYALKGKQWWAYLDEDDEMKNGSLTSSGLNTASAFLTTWMDYHYDEMQNTGEEDTKELARIQKESNPNFTKKDYEFYKKVRSVKLLTVNEIYEQIYHGEKMKKVKEKYKIGDHTSLDRLAMLGFKPVTFNRLNHPVTEEDEKNHAWNLKWLKAWEDDDVTTREEMIAATLPHMFDKIKLPDFKLSREDRLAFEEINRAEESYKKAKEDRDRCQTTFRTEKTRLESLMKQAAESKDDAAYQRAQKELADREKAFKTEEKLLQKEVNEKRAVNQKAETRLEELGVKYQGVYTKWIEGLVKNQDMSFIMTLLSGLSLDNMMEVHPSVKRFYELNPQFAYLSKTLDIAFSSFSSHAMEAKHRFKIGASVKVSDEQNHIFNAQMYKENMATDAGGFFRQLVKYDKVKNNKQVPFVSLSSTENYIANQEELDEYQTLLKVQPNLTQKGYAVMKFMKTVKSVETNKEYTEEYKKARDVLLGAHDGTYTRDATLVMRHVNFDKNNQPISEKDRENHAWNKQWLKAIDEDDFELREKMLAEEVPHHFQIKDLPKPSEKLLSLRRQMKSLPNKPKTWDQKRVAAEYKTECSKFQKEMERYTEDKIAKKDLAFFRDTMSGMTLDTLRKAHPSLQRYLDNNPEIDKRTMAIDAYRNLVAPYLARTYLTATGNQVEILPVTGQDLENRKMTEQMTEDQLTDDYLDKYMEYQKVQDAPYVPYKMIVRKEDLLRKGKRTAAKKEQERKDREEEEKRKKLEPIFTEYKKINPTFDPKRYDRLQQTNIRGEMFRNKEYQELAKKVTLKGFAGSLNGAMSFGLATIEMDENGNVKPEYKEAHEKNLAWLNMLIKAGEDGDMKPVRDQIEKEARSLLSGFHFPASHDFGDFNPYLMYLKDPVNMKTRMQKVQAYQDLVKGNPALAVSSQKEKDLGGRIDLLCMVKDLILEDVRQYNGIDFSGDTYQVVKPKQMTPEEIKNHKEIESQYLQLKEKLQIR